MMKRRGASKSEIMKPPKPKVYTAAAIKRNFKMHKALYFLALPMVIYVIIFNYVPMAWQLMAFQDFKPALGLFGSPWVGFDNFLDFFSSVYFKRVMVNTLTLNFKDLLISFPLTVIVALLLNEVGSRWFKKSVQVISYMPNFVSMVIICGLVMTFCGDKGVVTAIYNLFTGNTGSMMTDPDLFQAIYIWSGIWQGLGFGTILYVAALSGVNTQLYDAAKIDGANRLRLTWHVTLPGIAPTIILMLILRIGALMGGSFEKVILLYNSATMEKADIIASYVYRKGLIDSDYGYSTAVGLFNSVINLALIIIANQLSKKFSESSLF